MLWYSVSYNNNKIYYRVNNLKETHYIVYNQNG